MAAIAVGAYYLTSSSADCCSTTVDKSMEGCAEECGKGCGDACAESMDEACADSINQSCSSSGSTVTCKANSIGNMFANGLELIPIYVP